MATFTYSGEDGHINLDSLVLPPGATVHIHIHPHIRQEPVSTVISLTGSWCDKFPGLKENGGRDA